MSKVTTLGLDHVGLTVSNLELSERFFIECLGWSKIGQRPEYPASYVTDGDITITLWQVTEKNNFQSFDRKNNVGLHHIAFKVNDLESLNTIFEMVKVWDGVAIELAPEPSRGGPKVHFIMYEPGGNRLEFSLDPRKS